MSDYGSQPGSESAGQSGQYAVTEGWRDRMPWGAIWAGVVVALASYVLLVLLASSAGIMPFDVDPSDDGGSIQAAIAGLLAFGLGGLTLGGATRHRSRDDALFQSVVMWALSATLLVLLGVLGMALARDSFEESVGESSARQSARLGGGGGADGEEDSTDDAEKKAGRRRCSSG